MTHVLPRVGAAILAMFALLATVLVAIPANAAPPYQTNASIDSLEFQQDEIKSGSTARIDGTWSLPDNPTTPAGFVVDLPAELQGRVDAFDLLDPDGVAMGECTVTETQIFCDFDSQYLADNPLNLKGTFYFWVSVQTETTETKEVTYDFGEVSDTVTVTPPDGPCVGDCEWKGQDSYKWGSYDRESDIIQWHVNIASPAGGMKGGQKVTVTDLGGENIELIPGETRLAGTNQFNENGQPVGWGPKPEDFYTVSEDGSTVSFTSEKGWVYAVIYRTTVTDGGKAGTYTNSAKFEIEGEETVIKKGEVVRQGGGGTGDGDEDATPTPTDTPTETPTETPSPTETPTETPSPTETPTESPSPTETPTDTPAPTDTPSDSPAPTETPTAPAPSPSETPTTPGPGGDLPRTGVETIGTLAAGAALLAAGAVTLMLVRRRKISEES